MRLADGVLLCVDAAEGVMMVTDKVIKQAVAEGLPVCLLLTKVRGPSWQSLVCGKGSASQCGLNSQHVLATLNWLSIGRWPLCICTRWPLLHGSGVHSSKSCN